MLRDYEILYIVRPELDEPQLQEAVTSVNRLIENLGGASQKTDVWGRRRLAYEVGHIREGQYVLTDFQIEPERVPEMEATLKISDSVFRHLIVRKPEQRPQPPARSGASEARAAQGADSAAPVPDGAAPAPDSAAPAPDGAAPAPPAAAPELDDTAEDSPVPAEESTET